MILTTRFDSLIKTATLLVAGGLLLSACGDKTAQTTKGSTDGRSSYETASDHALGDPAAPITVVEYASVTCGACANWNNNVWYDFRTKYVDTGKVRFVYREFPTAPVDLAMAGHLIANCAPEEKFFDLIHVQFKRQREILSSTDIKGEYVRLAKSAGMSEADFEVCMSNEAEIERLNGVISAGVDAGVTGTPTFFINGEKYARIFKLEEFDKAFAEILGEPIPEPEAEMEKPAEHTDGDEH